MEHKQLATLFNRSAIESTQKVLALCGTLPARLSRQQAYRLYGRSDVDRWLTEGLLPSDERIDRLVLERIASRNNRVTYLPVAER